MIGTEVGRYLVGAKIASGGMANVHLGRLRGAAGFVRAVAIKSLHPALTKDPEIVATLIDEAHVASSIRHPNVVPILDVLSVDGDLFLIMEYVHGDSLAQLVKETKRRKETIPPKIAVGVAIGFLHGLHAAHEAKDENGVPLEIVHRDVSPKNVMVGVDGVSRVVDFGIAKAAVRAQTTQEGQLKGTLGYMSPEQLRGQSVDRRADVFAAGVVVWELLTGARLFQANDAGEIVGRILLAEIPAPSTVAPSLPSALDEVVENALARDPNARFATAEAFADALERALAPASTREIGEWVETVARESLAQRSELLRAVPATGEPKHEAHREEPTAPTSVSVEKPAAIIVDAIPAVIEPPRRSRTRAIVFVALLSLTVVGVSYGLSRSEAPASGPVSSPAPSASPSVSTPSPRPTSEVSAPIEATATPGTAAVKSTGATAHEGARAPWTAPVPRDPPTPAKTAKSCDPPYVMKGGIKQFKPECL